MSEDDHTKRGWGREKIPEVGARRGVLESGAEMGETSGYGSARGRGGWRGRGRGRNMFDPSGANWSPALARNANEDVKLMFELEKDLRIARIAEFKKENAMAKIRGIIEAKKKRDRPASTSEEMASSDDEAAKKRKKKKNRASKKSREEGKKGKREKAHESSEEEDGDKENINPRGETALMSRETERQEADRIEDELLKDSDDQGGNDQDAGIGAETVVTPRRANDADLPKTPEKRPRRNKKTRRPKKRVEEETDVLEEMRRLEVSDDE